MTVSASKDFVSIGALAAHLQRPVRQIEATVEVLRIEPAMQLNQIAYFDGDQVERIVQAVVLNDARTPLQQRAANLH